MFKALLKKRWREFLANKEWGLFVILLVLSLRPLLSLLPGMAPVVGILCIFLWFLGCLCAIMAFKGDFLNQANLFLEYLPVKRSSVWLANCVSGIAMLCLAVITLFWLDIVLYPLGIEIGGARGEALPDESVSELAYLFPERWSMLLSCGSFLFWMFSTAVFSAAYLDKKDFPNGNSSAGLFILGSLAVLPITAIATLVMLCVMPSGPALAPVLLVSGLLFSAGSFALFALTPKHISNSSRVCFGLGLLLLGATALVGQLYAKHLTWRVLDTSLPLRVDGICRPRTDRLPNLLLAEVNSYRSGLHWVSLDVEKAAYHDLGRGLSFIEMSDERGGQRLHFWYSLLADRRVGPKGDHFLTMAPDATDIHFFKPAGDWFYRQHARWLPDKRVLVYPAGFPADDRCYLCVSDSSGTLLKRFEIGMGSWRVLVNAAGQALALAPTVSAQNTTLQAKPADTDKPYMAIDTETGTIRRFALPGNAEIISKDLKHAVCRRLRLHGGRQYTSYVRVDLLTLKEKEFLSEDDCPVEEVRSQIDTTCHPQISEDEGKPAPFLRVDDKFDTALWIKQRVVDDSFCYSIGHVDLNTGRKQVVASESSLPKESIVVGGQFTGAPQLHMFTADKAGFVFTMGARVYLCSIKNRDCTLLADRTAGLDEIAKETPTRFDNRWDGGTAFSPSGRQVLYYVSAWQKLSPEQCRSFAAINVFRDGKPVRLHTGQRFIRGAVWLDEERIAFYEDGAIRILNTAGGPARQIFPPLEPGDSP
jgi:hypothetical protein